MHWFVLIIAGVLEIFWAIGLKYSDGFRKPLPGIATLVCMILSMGMLAFAVRKLPVGTAYAVWTGIGAAGTAILGILLFEESREPVRLLFLLLIIVGIVGLKYYS